jgi:D-proline reductase (dithiol) PrdB
MTRFGFYPVDVRNRFEQMAAEYSYIQPEPTPWTPLRHHLRDCKAALVTTSGIRLKTQHEFGAHKTLGSPDFREISTYVAPQDLAFDFPAFDPADAEADLNVIAPVDRLKELVDREVLGGLNETFFSFYGHCRQVEALRSRAAAAGRKMREQYGVDAAFVVPANFVCNQTAGIISRELEHEGISTVTLVTVREVAEQVKVPRPVFINFPFGRTLGPAHAVALQRSVTEDLVRVLRTADRPGRMTDLPYQWEGMVG